MQPSAYKLANKGKSNNCSNLATTNSQGCCLSALLFIIVVELVAISIKTNKNVKGIIINNTTYKISELADDSTLFIKDSCL